MLYDENSNPITNTQRPMVLSETERQRAYDFIKGMVYLWCNTNGEKPFYTRDLVGHINWNWEETPLQTIYDNFFEKYQDVDKAYKQSAITAGHILKHVLNIDKVRKFILMDEYTNAYYWKP